MAHGLSNGDVTDDVTVKLVTPNTLRDLENGWI